MRAKIISRSIVRTVALAAAALCLLPACLPAAEYGATSLVYEKATKMKRVSTVLFLSFLDQSASSDRQSDRRRLRCAVLASGKTGPLPARGEFIVRLLGAEAGPSAAWQSSELTEPVDGLGRAAFGDDAILNLLDEASADGAEVDLFRVEFDGGKGKKVTQVTIDCLHERNEG